MKLTFNKTFSTTKFINWLTRAGAEVLEPTNEYELIRFRAKGETGIIYTRKSGRLTFTGVAEEAFRAWRSGEPYEAADKTKRCKPSVHIQTLLKRDGDLCFYCGQPMPEDDRTLEHLVPICHGGPNHISNMVLAHGRCNQMADNLPVSKKVELRDLNRLPIEGQLTVNEWFGLTYARWLTVPRVVMEAMPETWQRKITLLLQEMNDRFDWLPDDVRLTVVAKRGSRFIPLPEDLCNYRRPNRQFLESIERIAS